LALVAFGFLLLAAHHALDLLDLVRSTRGAAYGAGYTDMNAQRPALLIVTACALLASALSIAGIFRRRLRLIAAGGAIWAVAVVLVNWAYPTVIQSVEVSPNELDRERPYIAATIQSTRHAFGIDTVQEQEVAYQDSVSADALAADSDTVN